MLLVPSSGKMLSQHFHAPFVLTSLTVYPPYASSTFCRQDAVAPLSCAICPHLSDCLPYLCFLYLLESRLCRSTFMHHLSSLFLLSPLLMLLVPSSEMTLSHFHAPFVLTSLTVCPAYVSCTFFRQDAVAALSCAICPHLS